MTPPNPRGPHRPSKGKHLVKESQPASGKGDRCGQGQAPRPPARRAPASPRPCPSGPIVPPSTSTTDGVRLQKLLAAAGVGSRRVCENLITQGRVEVDGQVVTELGVWIKATQNVHVDGIRIQLDESRVYLAFNKPLGVVTSMSDDRCRHR